MNNKIILLIAGILIVIGLIKPDFSSFIPSTKPNNSVVFIEAPADENIKKECEDVSRVLKNGLANDAVRLRDLFLDISKLIELDGEDLVIKTTEEIRQANGLAGPMLKLDIKNKYQNLANEAKEVIVSTIGDDNVPLTAELRKQAVLAFKYLAWACNEGAK